MSEKPKKIRYHIRKTLDYVRVIARPDDKIVEVNPSGVTLSGRLYEDTELLTTDDSGVTFQCENSDVSPEAFLAAADYIVVRNVIHHCYDIAQLLESIAKRANPSAKIIVVYYSALWKRLIESTRKSQPGEMNWIAPEDLENMARLSGWETISNQSRILWPINIPGLSYLVNRFLAPLAGFNWSTLVHVQVLGRVAEHRRPKEELSVSVIVPARNESGNIEDAVLRLPKMGPNDELIFIEGNSTDDTWEVIQEIEKKYSSTHRIKIGQQDGKGKYNAVRKGFEMAENEILMILDADLTVPPEELPVFYRALSNGLGEFINGSRLVYPMEDQAMRFFNILGNKGFAMAFSWVLGQRFKDTLCGTKVLTKENYERLVRNREYFGDFDPFGDFDLIFGASRMGLKIVEVPVHYKERKYGDTNIDRWRHGVILLRMLIFAANRLKFI